jgi:endo-1,4-beta-D-glucanase Y
MTFGIGFGQRGYWGNEHFATREEAEAAFDAEVTRARANFAASGRYIEREGTPAGNQIKCIIHTSVLKSGKPGKIRHLTTLYRIDS